MKLGRYELHSEIGRGGMGVVYRASAGEGDVALKVLLAAGPDALAIFEREQRLLASFSRADGFVPTLDSGEDDGKRWIAMPLLPGGTLRARLRAGPLPPDEAVALATRVARALGRAHERGVVHRDVKPENVIFTKEGDPLVADLGLAKHFRRDVLGSSRSRALSAGDEIRGTPGYMAPEQVDGKDVGPPADVFALGAILHECLAGEPPFRGKNLVEYGAALIAGPRALPKSAPAWLVPVLARALARAPGARFPDGGALARALEARPAASRRRLALGAFALAVAAVAALAASASRPAPVAPPVPEPTPAPSPASAAAKALALAKRALKELQANDDERALDDAGSAVELDPELGEAWLVRAQARSRLRDDAGARADVERAIQVLPTLAEAWALRAELGLGDGDPAALADAEHAVALAPGLAVAWEIRAKVRGSQGDLEAAIGDATRAIELEPGRASIWACRAVARGMLGDFPGVVADATRAIELDDRNAAVFANRGWARTKTGDLEGAKADFRRCLELAPDDSHAGALRDWLAKNAR